MAALNFSFSVVLLIATMAMWTATAQNTTGTPTAGNPRAQAAPAATVGRLTKAKADELRRRLAAAGGCNANICFAIDGSSSISAAAFEAEKNFVLDVASIVGVDEPVEMAAVQFSTATSRIQPLTVDSEKFVLSVNGAWQRRGGSFVTGGINYCFSQLFRRPFEANKIVLLGDGKQTIGSSAVDRANLFRSIGGRVAVVSAGTPDEETLLKIAGGNFDVVFEVDSFLDTIALQNVLTEMVGEICLSN